MVLGNHGINLFTYLLIVSIAAALKIVIIFFRSTGADCDLYNYSLYNTQCVLKRKMWLFQFMLAPSI